jgi:5-methylcytosine-specific restriction protein A
MPTKQRKYCSKPGCNRYADKGNAYCIDHKPQEDRVYKPYEAWYARGLWIATRSHKLMESPLCEECLRKGIQTKAAEVDHIIPHRGDWSLFIRYSNLQSLCTSCHSEKTRAENAQRKRKP